MPLYEYRCANCGLFEEWRTIEARSNPAHCPDCSQTGQRVFSSQGLISLNGRLRLPTEKSEPQLIKKSLEPIEQRIKTHGGSRPWMVTH
jgi:putative FmdB family regulatory protein